MPNSILQHACAVHGVRFVIARPVAVVIVFAAAVIVVGRLRCRRGQNDGGRKSVLTLQRSMGGAKFVIAGAVYGAAMIRLMMTDGRTHRRSRRRLRMVMVALATRSGRQIVHQTGDADQEQEEHEHNVEHEQRIERHQLHSIAGRGGGGGGVGGVR